MIRLVYEFADEAFGGVAVDTGEHVPVNELSDKDLIELMQQYSTSDITDFLTLKRISTDSGRDILVK